MCVCRRLHTNTKCIAICGKNVTASRGVSSETRSSAQPSPTRAPPKLCCLNNIFTNTPVSLRRARACSYRMPPRISATRTRTSRMHARKRSKEETNLNKYDIRAARGRTFAHRCASPRRRVFGQTRKLSSARVALELGSGGSGKICTAGSQIR